MEWVDAKDELPPINTIVRVQLTNGTYGFDFVNEPLDPSCPFQHYLVSRWRKCRREELIDILKAVRESIQ